MRAVARRGLVILIGAATAWLWIRLGLYGLGLPVGLTVLIPLMVLAGHYARTDRLGDLAMLLGAFAAAWATFETWTWLSAVSDPAVSIPDWTPVPLAAAIVLLVVAGAVGIAASSDPRRTGQK